MIESNDKVLVFIGTGWDAERNPFSFPECESFFSEYISWDFIVQELSDVADDEVWISNLLKMIDIHTTQNVSINFYGWDLENDYAIQVIQKYIDEKISEKVAYIEVPRNEYTLLIGWKSIMISATICRMAMEHNDWDFLQKVLPDHSLNIIKNKYV
jgi:citrate lyase synthetase